MCTLLTGVGIAANRHLHQPYNSLAGLGSLEVGGDPPTANFRRLPVLAITAQGTYTLSLLCSPAPYHW
jgi:hypothetical protein